MSGRRGKRRRDGNRMSGQTGRRRNCVGFGNAYIALMTTNKTQPIDSRIVRYAISVSL